MITRMTDLASIASYLQRIGAEPRSLRVAVIKEIRGAYWQDIATLKINKDGSIDAPDGYEPTPAEATLIAQEVLANEWPTSEKLGKGYALPAELQGINPETIFELKDAKGFLVMLQQRVNDPKSGEKRYIPWTYWSDGQWRRSEPEGPLPLYGLDAIGDNTTVFIHEGAKAARAMQRLTQPRTEAERAALNAHPWGRELQGAAHVGWIGGALSPSRTAWEELAEMGVSRAYIVADNDRHGKAAIPNISRRLRGMTVFSIEFTGVWPASFDLADEFPAAMFSDIAGTKHYTGPAFRDVVHPATWATDAMPNPGGKGRPVHVLRKEFVDLWVWIEETDTFICKEMPEINHGIAQFNAMVGPFSHVSTTAQLLHKTYKGRTAKVCYRPDIAARMVTDRFTSAINLHTPTSIRPAPGDPKPWLDFIEYLFPIERERTALKRWCATLIARPEIRMLYGLLLVSERQGMGKSTLGERILAPLVGLNNTGFPGERDIVESNFNGWVANKRLVVVGEIYTGQSFKAYNMLKSYLTDKNISVNEKFQRPYTIENWVHVVACSNSKKALRVEESDRRWFYPQLNEEPWSRAEWGSFYSWLASGGLSIIMQWAMDHGDYVLPGEHAPATATKTVLIRDSKGELINHWLDILEAAEQEDEDVAFAVSEARETLRKRHGKVFESPNELKKEAVKRGWVALEDRISVEGSLSYVVCSPKAAKEIGLRDKDLHAKEAATAARKRLKLVKDLLGSSM